MKPYPTTMALRSQDRKLSFDILAAISQYEDDDDDMSTTTSNSLIRSKSDPHSLQNDAAATASDLSPTRNNKKKKKKKKKNKKGRPITHGYDMIPENIVLDDHNECINNKKSVIDGEVANYRSRSSSSVTITEVVAVSSSSREVVDCVSGTGTASLITTTQPLPHQFGELRQRTNVNAASNGSGNVEMVVVTEEIVGSGNSGRIFDDCGREEVVENVGKQNSSELKGRKLEREQTLDWKELVVEDPNYTLPIEKSPLKYFLEEMYAGNSLRSTTTLANEKERERVYDTIFRLPWRCELLINIGFFVCFDSFLSLLTIMPTRIIITFWRCLKTRQFKRPSSSELADFGCFVVLISGVTLLQQADISLIYHMIRGQGIIKLYVVYNVLEVFDKLCQSFGGDVIQALFNSADGLANCSPENMHFWLWRFILDEALAVASSILHSFILLAQAITLSTCIVAHNNALFAMLVSNNFAEIKSNVFKRYSKDNVHSLVYFDSVERFHISAFVLFVLAQNILEAEGPWFESFLCNALVVYICEVMIDIIKHSFIAKFNNIKPIAFSEFLEDLCKQTLNIQTENGKNNLTFVPLAPACVVIRVLRPVYAAHLPSSPLPWRLFWILVLFAMTFIMLASLKVLMGMGLRQHARWYLKRCERRKLHSD